MPPLYDLKQIYHTWRIDLPNMTMEEELEREMQPVTLYPLNTTLPLKKCVSAYLLRGCNQSYCVLYYCSESTTFKTYITSRIGVLHFSLYTFDMPKWSFSTRNQNCRCLTDFGRKEGSSNFCSFFVVDSKLHRAVINTRTYLQNWKSKIQSTYCILYVIMCGTKNEIIKIWRRQKN